MLVCSINRKKHDSKSQHYEAHLQVFLCLDWCKPIDQELPLVLFYSNVPLVVKERKNLRENSPVRIVDGNRRKIYVEAPGTMYQVGKKVLSFFWQISYRTVESSHSFDTKGIARGCDYCSNERLSIDMDAHKRAEMNIFRREILALLLHEFD